MLNSLTMFNEHYLKNHTEDLRKRFPTETKNIEEEYSHREIKPIINIEELATWCENDEQLEKLLNEVVDYFFKYTETVCEYNIIVQKHLAGEDVEDQLASWDEIRHHTHNAMIDSVVILIRNIKNKKPDWSKNLPPKENRVAYGALAMENTFLELLKYKEENNDPGQ